MDEALGRTVAIGIFPAAFAQRGRDGTMQPVSREKDTFSTGIVGLHQRGQTAGAVRSPGAGARLSLLGGAWHAYLAMRLYDG